MTDATTTEGRTSSMDFNVAGRTLAFIRRPSPNTSKIMGMIPIMAPFVSAKCVFRYTLAVTCMRRDKEAVSTFNLFNITRSTVLVYESIS